MFKEGSKKMAEEEIEELKNKKKRKLNIEIRDLTLDLEDCKQRDRGR